MTVTGGWKGGSQTQRQGENKVVFIIILIPCCPIIHIFVSYSVADRQKRIIVSSFRLFSSTVVSESSFALQIGVQQFILLHVL